MFDEYNRHHDTLLKAAPQLRDQVESNLRFARRNVKPLLDHWYDFHRDNDRFTTRVRLSNTCTYTRLQTWRERVASRSVTVEIPRLDRDPDAWTVINETTSRLFRDNFCRSWSHESIQCVLRGSRSPKQESAESLIALDQTRCREPFILYLRESVRSARDYLAKSY